MPFPAAAGVPPMFVEIATRGVLAMPLFYDGAEVGDVIDTDCAARCAGMGGGERPAALVYTYMGWGDGAARWQRGETAGESVTRACWAIGISSWRCGRSNATRAGHA